MITLSDLLYKVTWSENGVAGVCRGSDTLMEVQDIYTKLDIYRYAMSGQAENIILYNKLVEITVQLLFFMPLLS